MSEVFEKLGVIGGGAWGTALAQTLCRAGRSVTLWARETEVVGDINANHVNSLFLPGVPLEPTLRASGSLLEIIADAEAVLVVCPAQALRSVLESLADRWPAGVPVVLCAKGIEQKSGMMMTEVAAEVLPGIPQMVLSGPTFAHEVALGLPSAVTVAAHDIALSEKFVRTISTPTFRPYVSVDPVGAEIGGAVKNVLAIACGIVEGRSLGENARAALLTRGLAEMIRLGRALGAQAETLAGLSGMGDLILTATSTKSRNFSVGYGLGQGGALDEIMGKRRSVAEGVHSARAVVERGALHGIEMPICQAVDQLLQGLIDVDSAVAGLLNRPLRSELG
ncbi:NAD(P)-dependent glycerol-3-phosphate dehydrogenase [Phaeovibrio sulfidiphilus]|uniref:Glycerol-3-phosphate dehydrogenase [NAD(P)+] n=1 Tax=Phaeovibrio sulfidiphilus TaxID=1220600 RepID=A0A8J6YLF3_9PROT|nr:NAD(P)H-dependent glycerol-3-phosphate dehydrogenase [Phaeovibrio sulfidiphilus]MBE1236925.1 NAD(P)-dependent glycerol-3-phosphate dehydrogenase [Phaeovibrio sulfidiphilus]